MSHTMSLSPRRPVAGLLAVIFCGAVAGAAVGQQPTPSAPPQQPQQPQQPQRPAGESPRPDRTRPPRDVPRQQAPEVGTAVVKGRVTAADTGRPVKRARVFVGTGQGRSRAATTDEQGRFEVGGLAAGRYTVTVSKTGFVTLSYGQRRPSQPAMPLALADGQTLQGVDVSLPRGSVLSGRVFDEDGEPLAGASVRAMRVAFVQGERSLMPAGVDVTDDRGEFRVYGLAPGEYVVSAVVRGPGGGFFPGAMRGGGFFGGQPSGDEAGETLGYAPTYFPGTASIEEAGRVALELGQETTNLDFGVQLVPLARVSGRVIVPRGTVPRDSIVTLVTDGSGMAWRAGGYSARPDAEGDFTVANVPPGRYRLVAQTLGRFEDTPAFATLPLTVAGTDIAGLGVTLAPGAELSGSVVVEGGGSGRALDLASMRVVTRPVEGRTFRDNAAANPTLDGRFRVAGIPPGLRVVRVAGLPRGWSLKSITVGSHDASDQPVEFRTGERVTGATITITDRVSQLSGHVLDTRGAAATDVTVIVFPPDSDAWTSASRRIEAVRPDQEGRYEVSGLPGGTYLVGAADEVSEGEWLDPAFLERLRPAAATVQLNDGEARAHDVRVAR